MLTHKEFKQQMREWEEWNRKHPVLHFFKSNYHSFIRFIKGARYWYYEVLYGFQRMFRGYDGKRPWTLNYELAKYILPKLKGFKGMPRCGYVEGMTPKEWEKILDKMIWSMERVVKDDIAYDKTYKQQVKLLDKQQEGMELFGKYFTSLWD